MSETPKKVWLQPLPTSNGYYVTGATDDLGVVPYVRQDIADGQIKLLRGALESIANSEHAMNPCATRYSRNEKNAAPFTCDCPVGIACAALKGE